MLKKTLISVLFASLTTVLFLVFFELGVRVYNSFNDDFKENNFSESVYCEVPFLNLRLLPGITFNQNRDIFKFFLTPFNTNMHGFRGKDFSVVKDKDIYRIICIGASTTFGHGSGSDNTTYPAFLESKLNSHFPSRRFQVINAGIPGYSALQEYILFSTQLLEFSPDMIVIYSGWNDISSMFHLNSSNYEKMFVGSDNIISDTKTSNDKYFTRSKWAVLRQIGRWKYKMDKKKRIVGEGYRQVQGKEERRRLMVKNIKAYLENDFYFNRPIRIYSNSIESIISLAQRKGIKVVLLTLPEIINESSPSEFFEEFKKKFPDSVSLSKGDFYTEMRLRVQERFNSLIRELAERNNCILVDIDREFPRDFTIFSLFCDEAHFTDKGNALTADLILKKIKDKI